MAPSKGRNVNKNDTAYLSDKIVLNTATSTTIIAENSSRIFLAVNNDDALPLFIKLQAASVDDVQKGIKVPANGYWEMQPDNLYIGEVSAIASMGSPGVFVTEY